MMKLKESLLTVPNPFYCLRHKVLLNNTVPYPKPIAPYWFEKSGDHKQCTTPNP